MSTEAQENASAEELTQELAEVYRRNVAYTGLSYTISEPERLATVEGTGREARYSMVTMDMASHRLVPTALGFAEADCDHTACHVLELCCLALDEMRQRGLLNDHSQERALSTLRSLNWL